MNRLNRILRVALVGLALTWALPAPAQSFEGLDTTETKPKKKKGKKKKTTDSSTDSTSSSSGSKHSKRKGKSTSKSTATSTEAPAEAAPAAPAPAAAPGKSAAPVTPAPAPSMTQGLDLTQPEPPKAAQKPAPTTTFEALDVSGKSGDRQKLDAAISLFRDEKYEQASMAAYELMKDPKVADLHLEAQYVLAKSLYRMGLYHSSLGEFSKILARGPSSKFFKSSLEWLFFISRKTKNETVILDEIAKYANSEFPEKFRNEFRYLLARYHFVRGRALDQVGQKGEADKSFDEVKRLALIIPRSDPFYPRAKYLEGLAYFRAGSQVKDPAQKRTDPNFRASIESMKEVIRLTRPGTKTGEEAKLDQSLRELAFMQLARTHYGLQQNRFAIFYFNKVERGGNQWLESLFESSWANYRVGQYEQALGNLITLSSPFFREEYFPEALILKAVIYYENCRYRESTLILEDFERIYLPVHDQLELIANKQMDPAEYYGILADIQKKNREAQASNAPKNSTDVILERILRLALTDQDLKKTNDSILELESEMDSFGEKPDTFKYSELSKSLIEGLKVQRSELVNKAGIMAKGKLETELAALKQLLANGLRIKFETTTKEKEFLEEQLKAGGRTAIVKSYKYSVAVADDQLYWPFEGEYWRDELGTYQYTLTKGCIDRDRANRTVPASAQ
ncbi:adventurous gliding motility protein GltC [Aggregicoccus sp. 17bor-14]|uniref:adventurous gliding motility protein GltC n=1 Tax=Myxococcaceae TaxID=31 RepID=UPI00129C723A|nr:MULTISPECIES: adventurous gliding motility protein GltC [Myxococcaceae]MBF5044935.1 adventurous gliding motility protein GltC [Simulacricoccus sp. 17bor-14]MRI90678.1 adventurous gliding motility protein GltC [Aggregicoccus sp. 17bor-14]